MKKLITFCAVVVLFFSGYVRAFWVTLDMPDATDTYICGIDGINLVGCYTDASGKDHGFLYDWISWVTLDAPGAIPGTPGACGTHVNGISGNKLVGQYESISGYHGFLYDSTILSWTSLDAPASNWTQINGISGGNLVGRYYDASGLHGFFYDGTTWTTLNMPGASATLIYGIDASNLVGCYQDASGFYHGFLYNGANWFTIDKAGATNTWANAIDSSNIVGWYVDASGTHGFLYNLTTDIWITLDYPGATDTLAFGIDGSNVVGSYTDSNGEHGFIYTIPEPATLTIIVEPNDVGIDTITPSVGPHDYARGWVSIKAERFINCPDVYTFDHWDDDVNEPNSPSTTVYMDENKSITAVFVDARQCGDECHPYPQGDVNKDCKVNFLDVAIVANTWLECTDPNCD
jgi:hypothetical protein